MIGIDWKDEAQYEYLNSLNNCQWAFEFLRRNDEYQSDYLEYKKRFNQLTGKYGPYTEENQKEWYKDTDYWHFEPPIQEGENYQAWLHRCAHLFGDDPQRTIIEMFLIKKWGLVSSIFDPSQPADTSIEFELTGDFPKLPDFEQAKIFFEDDIYGPEDDVPEYFAGPDQQISDCAVVVFSFHHDLDEQFKAAKSMVKEKLSKAKETGKVDVLPKAKNPSHSNAKARDYLKRLLRVIDAKRQGCKHKEIAKILYPDKSTYDEADAKGEKQVSKDYLKACEYIRRKYRSLPLLKAFSPD